jgi:hypothetical protein
MHGVYYRNHKPPVTVVISDSEQTLTVLKIQKNDEILNALLLLITSASFELSFKS